MAAGLQTSFIVIRTSSDHTVSRCPQRTYMLLLWVTLLWWRPAISHYSFPLVFRLSLLLRLSEHQIAISPGSSLKLQLDTRDGTTKKLTSSSYRKFGGATQKKKIKQATKPKTKRLASNVLLVPSKIRKRIFCLNPTPSDTPSDSDTDLTVPFADVSTEEEQDAECVFCIGRLSEDHNGGQWIRCAKYFRWAHTLCAGMEENTVGEICQG
jgi:hypothetical protein